jgi:alkylation response protein AidB-like acyl-CoA dehydrogenase
MVYGAIGYITEEGLEREVRDAIGGLIYSGTSDIQRNIIARFLGVG